ncbi:MAG: starch-binding protein, partial [Lachnospiraceae bacterium]|nr:starch-binding protein [Lachnospiraceae bacterium]
TDGIIFKLTTSNSTAATYSINDGKNYKFTSGKTIKIGAGCEYGTKITVTVKAENNDATTFKTYTFTKVDPLSGLNVTFTKPSSWNSTVYAYVYKENGSKVSEVQAWPGVAMTVSSGNKYTVRIDDLSFDGGYVIFSDGNNQTPGARETGFVLNNNGNYDVNGLMGNVTEGEVVVYYYTGWSNANIHYSVNGGAWTAVPGINMTSAGNGYMKAAIKNVSGKLNFCFNDGKGNWDNNGGSDYELKETGTFTIKDGKITKGEPAKVETNSITIYYSTGWSNANCHYSIGGGTWTSVPGVSMTNGKNGYKVITIDLNTATNLTACFNDGNGNWDNNYSKNYYFGAAGTYTVSNGNITSGAAY